MVVFIINTSIKLVIMTLVASIIHNSFFALTLRVVIIMDKGNVPLMPLFL